MSASPPERALGRHDVAHVARLARLDLTDEELDRFTGQLAAVLGHAADVAALDLAGRRADGAPAAPGATCSAPTSPQPCLDRDEVLAAAPAVEDDRFRVPRILGEAP